MAWRPSPGEETRKEVQGSHSALGRSVCQGCEPQFFESPDSGGGAVCAVPPRFWTQVAQECNIQVRLLTEFSTCRQQMQRIC